MLEIAKYAKSIAKMASDNSPTLLTSMAVAGTFTTALLTGKASWRAAEIINQEEMKSGTAADFKQRFKERFPVVWKLYIPPVIVGAGTIACVIGANTVSSRRNAALLSVYTLSESAMKEYKEKVVEQIGDVKETKIRDAIAQDQVNASPPQTSEIVFTGEGEVLFRESLTGRYFKSEMEAVRKSVNDLNARLLNDGYVSLNDLFDELGLPVTGFGEEMGWKSDKLIEPQYSAVMAEDNKPCISIGYTNTPGPNYYKHG